MFEYIIHQLLASVFSLVLFSYTVWYSLNLLQMIAAMFAYSLRVSYKQDGLLWSRYREIAPPISIIIPAFNEAKTIPMAINALLTADYPDYEIIIVNDGSTDNMINVVNQIYDLQPIERPSSAALQHKKIHKIYQSRKFRQLYLVDKENGGKADAQNAGINIARTDLLCMVDADTIVAPDALLRLVQPFIDNENLVAVGGTIMVANGCQLCDGRFRRAGLRANLLVYFQALEYLRAFLIFRVGITRLKMSLLISGALGVFSRQCLLDVQGYTNGSIGEDLDLILKIHYVKQQRKQKYEIGFVPDAMCWTEAPENLAELSRQRRRWQHGALEAFSRYGTDLFDPRFGRVGLLSIPLMLLIDIIGPILELSSYILFPVVIYTGVMTPSFLLSFIFMVLGFGMFLSYLAISLEEKYFGHFDRVKYILLLCGASLLESFGYRQLNNVWRIRAIWEFYRGQKNWEAVQRNDLKNLVSTNKI